MGEKWLQEFLGPCFFPVLKKKSVQEILGLCLFLSHSPPCLGLPFPLYPFLIFFSTIVLETRLGGQKAACIGPALPKFRPSVGDAAT